MGKGIDAFAFVLRAVLANSPNSIPPERVFSVLNDTFEEDMDNSYADYIELSLQLQFNSRSRDWVTESVRDWESVHRFVYKCVRSVC